MLIKVIKHRDLSSEDLRDIINIKKQHWNYGYESQKKWIQDQFLDNDKHIVAIFENKIVGYIGINELWCNIDEVKYNFSGVVNLCVDKKMQGHGVGRKILDFFNQYLVINDKNGILLCNNQITSFYSKSNWHLMEYKVAFVAGESFTQNIMTYNFDVKKANIVYIEKNF